LAGDFYSGVSYYFEGKQIVFACSQVTVIKRFSGVTEPPLEVASPLECSHIPLPCGAASLPLPFGTGHEKNIPLVYFAHILCIAW